MRDKNRDENRKIIEKTKQFIRAIDLNQKYLNEDNIFIFGIGYILHITLFYKVVFVKCLVLFTTLLSIILGGKL